MIIYQYKIYDNESNEVYALKESSNPTEIEARLELLNKLAEKELQTNTQPDDTF